MKPQSRLTEFLRGYGRLTVFLMPIGIATNFIGGQVANLLKLPLWLDSIGTILVGALCGAWPGALVGLISNLINSITAPTLLPFASVNILLGVTAAWLSQIGAFRALWSTLLTSIPFAAIGGILGGLLTIWIFGGLGGNGVAIITGGLLAFGMDLVPAVFVSTIPAEVLDKGVTALIVFFILSRIPMRLFVKVPLGHVYYSRKRRTVIEVPDDELALKL